ncbi:hypothetical protein BV375_19570 [Nostoc sp. 106C]|nr:hypothetical protein BV375_19570 [Nostoc sp. 106C]
MITVIARRNDVGGAFPKDSNRMNSLLVVRFCDCYSSRTLSALSEAMPQALRFARNDVQKSAMHPNIWLDAHLLKFIKVWEIGTDYMQTKSAISPSFLSTHH